GGGRRPRAGAREPGAAERAAVGRGPRSQRQPAAAGAAGAGESVPGPPGRGAGLVALPPPVRRPAPRPPGADAAPERVPELHRAAAAWHEAHGFADDAIRHALAAGDPAWAARLVERPVEALLRPR